MVWQSAQSQLRVALLVGGQSHQRDVSLESGRAAAAALQGAGHEVVTFDPAEEELDDIAWSAFDAAFLALHGGAGEDGRLQRRLESLKVPYTGSGPLTSQLAICKSISKDRFYQVGVPTLPYTLLDAYAPLDQLLPKLDVLHYPLVFKPDGQGSSLGLTRVRCPEEAEAGLRNARRYDPFVLAEPQIDGREFSVAILGRRPLPPVEILVPGGLYDFHAKHESGQVELRQAENLTDCPADRLQEVALSAAAALGTCGLVRVDVMLDGLGQPWVLEVNTLPPLATDGLAATAARVAGMQLSDLCDWMLRDCLGARVSM